MLFKIITRMKLFFFGIIYGITVTACRGLPNQLALQLQFPCFSSRIQLQEIIPQGIFKNLLQLQLHDLYAHKTHHLRNSWGDLRESKGIHGAI